MASDMVISGASFNPLTDMKYTKPKVNSVGGRSVGIINSKTSTVLNLSSPLMLTWGVQEFTDDKTGKVSYDLALQFPNEGFETPATKKFITNMATFEKKIKEDAILNSKEWFSKPKMTADAVDALWTPVLKYPKNKETLEADMTRAPTLKVKLPLWDGKFQCEIYDTNGTMMYPDAKSPNTPVDLITKGMNIVAIIQCGGLWFANGKFGCTWRLFQTVVQPKPSLKGRCLIACSPAVKQALVTAAATPSMASDETGLTIEEDSDYEADPEPEDVPVPVAVAVVAPAPVAAVAPAKIKVKSAPAPAPAPAPVPAPVPAAAAPEPTVEETAPLIPAAQAPVVIKKKVVRKKE